MKHEIPELLARIREVRIGIVGDFCLDAYFLLDPSASEVSVETGLPTWPVRVQRYSPGGAGNVACNLAALGVREVRVFGVAGADPFGREMRRLLDSIGADTTGLLVQEEGWQTCTYAKPYEGERERSRLDFGNFNGLSPAVARDLLRAVEEAMGGLDVLIVNQQLARGIHTEDFRSGLVERIARHPDIPCLVDSRSCSDAFDGTFRKINDREGARLLGREEPDGPVGFEAARQIARELHRRWRKPLFLTRGEHGCLVCDRQGLHEVPGLLILSPVDPVGAGDSMLAGIAAALAAGEDPVGAAELGNFAAGVTVQKLRQTGTAAPEEILAIGADPDYRYRPEVALQPHRARHVADSEIEWITPLPESPDIGWAIFDHDGTISTLRQGWEEVMEPMMITAIFGNRLAETEEAVYGQVRDRVRGYIEKTNGIQTLVQMKGLASMVREFGFVPPERILDEHGYKAIYNEALMERVNRRVAKLKRGEIDRGDCTLKGAVELLEELHRRGVKLFLASGTDQEDVRREAGELGYASLFGEHIYGSIGVITHEPKKMVLTRILADIERQGGGRVCTFGDGPVEIRETHKRGGLTVGVASDEVRRYGLNPAKRARLIQAGADLIVPDFSQRGRLLELLYPKERSHE